MTNKIAIEYLKDMLASAEANLHVPDMAEHAEALDMAIEALEASQEQTERKAPIYYGDGYSDGYMVYDSAECPSCGYIYEEDDGVWGEPYCPHCGQVLDWNIGGEADD